jgi:hypothetical protein
MRFQLAKVWLAQLEVLITGPKIARADRRANIGVSTPVSY